MEVQEGYTLESMILIAYIGIFAESARSILSWDVEVPTQFNIEPVIGAAEA